MIVPQYMAALDSPDPASALAFMEPDVHFHIVLPGRVVSGTSRDEWAEYIGGRNVVGRIHHILRASTDRDVELVHGLVTEDDDPKGIFLSSAVISSNNRIQRYLAFFDTTYRLLDWPAEGAD